MGREERRKQERADRKAAWNELPDWQKKLVTKLGNEGLSLRDMEKEHEKGYRLGYENGLQHAMKTCYAGAALAAVNTFGAEQQKVIDFLMALDQKVTYALTSEELIDEVFESLNLQIGFANSEFGHLKEA